MKRFRHSSPDRHQGVGYRKPPAHTRWKTGQSGNPKGRRKAVKTVAQMLDEALTLKVPIDEDDGRRVTLTMQEIILRKLAYAAARGDMNAIKTVFALRDRYQDSNETRLDPAELDPNDQAIIQDYLEKIRHAAEVPDRQADTDQTTEQSADADDIARFPPPGKRRPE